MHQRTENNRTYYLKKYLALEKISSYHKSNYHSFYHRNKYDFTQLTILEKQNYVVRKKYIALTINYAFSIENKDNSVTEENEELKYFDLSVRNYYLTTSDEVLTKSDQIFPTSNALKT